MANTQHTGMLYQKIAQEHNEYCIMLGEAMHNNEPVDLTERVDRIAFHVIEEIIEMRRTYPHKFWRKSEEDVKTEEMIGEAVDVFLMVRAMIKEVCLVADIDEEQFLIRVLEKVFKNKERLQNGY